MSRGTRILGSRRYAIAAILALTAFPFPRDGACAAGDPPPALHADRSDDSFIEGAAGKSVFGATGPRAELDLPAIAKPASQGPARLVVGLPLSEALVRGLVVIPYRTENLRIVPVYGPGGLEVVPRIGHLHITLDDALWHWVDASGEPIIIQFLPPGPHNVLIQLADPTHRIIDSHRVYFNIPQK